MYLRGLSDEFKTYHSIKKDIYSDGLIDDEGIEEIKRNIPELSFRQEYLCEFLDSSLTFFQGFEKCFKDYQYKYNKTWIGVDLSGSGTDKTILSKINENDETETFIIEGSLDYKYRKIADIINSSTNLQACYIESNGIGSPMINEITKLVKHKILLHPFTTTNTTKEEIISEMAVKIANNDISFNNDDKLLYSELSTFVVTYSKTHKLQFGGQGNSHDDSVMATAITIKAKKDFKYSNNFSFAKAVQTRKRL